MPDSSASMADSESGPEGIKMWVGRSEVVEADSRCLHRAFSKTLCLRLGFLLFFVAGAFWTWTITKKIIWGDPFFTDPFFTAGIFVALAGLQLLLFGVLSELIMRTYYESQRKPTYTVKETINLAESRPERIAPKRH